jgi:hypothetical protein
MCPLLSFKPSHAWAMTTANHLISQHLRDPSIHSPQYS